MLGECEDDIEHVAQLVVIRCLRVFESFALSRLRARDSYGEMASCTHVHMKTHGQVKYLLPQRILPTVLPALRVRGGLCLRQSLLDERVE